MGRRVAPNISNSQFMHLVDEWIRSERDREITKKRFIDGVGFEVLAEEFNLSVRRTKDIAYQCLDKVMRKVL